MKAIVRKTWYSYDIMGRVTWIIQKISGVDGVKTIDYLYDINGKVTNVIYEKNNPSERFEHRYKYDVVGKMEYTGTRMSPDSPANRKAIKISEEYFAYRSYNEPVFESESTVEIINDVLTVNINFDFQNENGGVGVQVGKIFDLDFQHQLKLGNHHDLIWGVGYRNIRDAFDNSFQLVMSPDSTTREIFSAFFQDEIMLMPDRLWFILGSKIEHNDFTGYEIQPNGRLLFRPVDTQTVWASVSRAVRTPSRSGNNSRFTVGMIPDLPPFAAPLFFKYVFLAESKIFLMSFSKGETQFLSSL